MESFCAPCPLPLFVRLPVLQPPTASLNLRVLELHQLINLCLSVCLSDFPNSELRTNSAHSAHTNLTIPACCLCVPACRKSKVRAQHARMHACTHTTHTHEQTHHSSRHSFMRAPHRHTHSTPSPASERAQLDADTLVGLKAQLQRALTLGYVSLPPPPSPFPPALPPVGTR
jgi:hypothetical protein